MNTYLKRTIGTLVVLIPVYILFFFWFSQIDPAIRFSNDQLFLSLGRIFGLLSMVLFSIALILHTRIKLLTYIMDIPYILKLHHIIGSLSFILVLAHPILLAFRYFALSPYSAARFLLPSDDNFPNLLGLGALFLMTLVILITNYFKGDHSFWIWTHRMMFVVLAASLLHVLLVNSDITGSIAIKVTVYGMSVLGILAFGYQRYLKKLQRKVTVTLEGQK